MVKIAPDGPRVCKHVLPTPPEVHAGYRTLHIQEATYTRKALEAMPDAVANWYGYLTLYDQTLRREHEWPQDESSDAYWSWSVRLNLAAGALASTKLALDAALAGYYSQAYGLLRHMAETWEQMVYLRFNEEAGKQWFSPDGVQPAREPSQGTILRGIRRHGKSERGLLGNLNVVEEKVQALNKGAHPSGLMMVQVSTTTPGMRQLGGPLNEALLGACMDLGTVLMALLHHEIQHIAPVDADWETPFDALGEDRRQWQRAAFHQELGEVVPLTEPQQTRAVITPLEQRDPAASNAGRTWRGRCRACGRWSQHRSARWRRATAPTRVAWDP